jgi:FdhD protein
MWRQGIEGAAALFYTTGRLTSEMVIKCAQMGVPVLMSRSGLTGMGHALAERLGLTMLARCQGRHFLVFTGAHRMQVSHTP